jgi:hypothetical protein
MDDVREGKGNDDEVADWEQGRKSGPLISITLLLPLLFLSLLLVVAGRGRNLGRASLSSSSLKNDEASSRAEGHTTAPP